MSRIGSEVVLLLSTVVLARMISPSRFRRLRGGADRRRPGHRDPHGRGWAWRSCSARRSTASISRQGPRWLAHLAGGWRHDCRGLLPRGAPADRRHGGRARPPVLSDVPALRHRDGPGGDSSSAASTSAACALMEVSGNVARVVVRSGWSRWPASRGDALAYGLVAGAAVSSAIAMTGARPPLPRLRRRAVRDISEFGLPAALAAVAWTGFANGDYAVIAARLGTVAAGQYWRAYTLAVSYQSKVSILMQSMAFPLLSRSATDRGSPAAAGADRPRPHRRSVSRSSAAWRSPRRSSCPRPTDTRGPPRSCPRRCSVWGARPRW